MVTRGCAAAAATRAAFTLGACVAHTQLNREDVLVGCRPVARCTTALLMKDLGLRGISRTKGPRTTDPGTGPDSPPRPRRAGLHRAGAEPAVGADITYVRTFAGWVYCAFVLDVSSRRVVCRCEGAPYLGNDKAGRRMGADCGLGARPERCLDRFGPSESAPLGRALGSGSRYISLWDAPSGRSWAGPPDSRNSFQGARPPAGSVSGRFAPFAVPVPRIRTA